MNRLNTIAIGMALMLTQLAYADGIEDLAIYKSGGPTQGLWRMELLSSSDKEMSKMSDMTKGVAVCMDTAKQLSKEMQAPDNKNKCTSKIIRNTRSIAEIAVSCETGMHSHTTVTRENEKSFLMDTDMTSKEGKQRNMKARYQYEGACKGDSLIQMDKNSEACKRLGNVDMSKMAGMCANMQPEQRAACEQRMKQFASMCK